MSEPMSDERLADIDGWFRCAMGSDVRLMGEELVAEVRRLRQQVDELECTLDDEEAAHQETLVMKGVPPLAWTKEPPPREPRAWYWFRKDPRDCPECVLIDSDGLVMTAGDDNWNRTPAELVGEWAGPLQPPGS